jgi:hypothetical protein
MKKAIVIVTTLGIVLFLGGAVLAKDAASGYSVPWHAFTSGGEHDMSSDNYTMFSTAGQELVGGTSSDNYQLEAGFWTVMEAQYTVYLPLVLRNY